MVKDLSRSPDRVVPSDVEAGAVDGPPGGLAAPFPPAVIPADPHGQGVQITLGRPPMARPYAAAGALFFDDEGRVLLVEPSYKPGWDIPGGFVEPGESPYSACVREVEEELGIRPPIGELLVIDWATCPTDGWLDSEMLLFVFDGGRLSDSWRERIRPDMHEIINCAFVPVAEVAGRLPKLHARRVQAAARLRGNPHPAGYLEGGQHVPSPAPASTPATTRTSGAASPAAASPTAASPTAASPAAASTAVATGVPAPVTASAGLS